MRIGNVFSTSVVAAALVATSLSVAGPAAATLMPPKVSSLQPAARPLNPPAGGAQQVTYYSDSTYTTVVGQRFSTSSSPCPSPWGITTSYYKVVGIACP